ncbi:MAG: hypothetical protein ACRDK7_09520 [Solirubrobacteraceae bacterium]
MLSLLAAFAVGAVASASASAQRWVVCEEVAGEGTEPPTKYDEHKCNTQVKALKERKWEWKELLAEEHRKVKSHNVGTFTLHATVGGIKVKISCTAVKDTGEIWGGNPGTDEDSIEFEGCTVTEPTGKGCKVHGAGLVVGRINVSNVKTKLEVLGGVLTDTFTPAAPPTFVEIVIEGCEGGAKALNNPYKIEGTSGGVVVAGTGKLKFTATSSNLKFGGEPAKLEGETETELENGSAIKAE